MYCKNCGAEIPEGESICAKCRTEESGLNTPMDSDTSPSKFIKETTEIMGYKVPKVVIIAIVVVVILVIAAVVVTSAQKAKLNDLLERTWVSVEDSIILVLEFDGEQVEYRLESTFSFLDQTLYVYDYEVMWGNKYKVNWNGEWKNYTVDYEKGDNSIKIIPSMISSDPYDIWIDYEAVIGEPLR